MKNVDTPVARIDQSASLQGILLAHVFFNFPLAARVLSTAIGT